MWTGGETKFVVDFEFSRQRQLSMQLSATVRIDAVSLTCSRRPPPSGSTDYEVTVTRLEPFTYYEFTVRSHDADNTYGPYSEGKRVRTMEGGESVRGGTFQCVLPFRCSVLSTKHRVVNSLMLIAAAVNMAT